MTPSESGSADGVPVQPSGTASTEHARGTAGVPLHASRLVRADDTQPPPDADCVLSSRIRLARNLLGFHFVNKASPPMLSDIVHRVQSARFGGPFAGGVRWVNVQATAPADRLLLFERNLISRPFVEAQHPRGVAISSDESASVMVNEEDHLRLQMLAPGLQLVALAERIFALDAELEHSLEFAFHPRFGYLTACPTNVGTGIRVSAMLHLPALRLLEELDKVQRAAKDLHLAVRGFHGEGTDALGDFFQVSNQVTLGRSEIDIVEEFNGVIVPRFIAYERAARRALLERDAASLDDRIYRALGILRTCRLLTLDEAIKFLSRLRLGAATGRLTEVPLGLIDRLLLEVQPAHLARTTGCELGADRAARAEFVRRSLR